MDAARKLMREGCHSLIICAPTGSGKTALAAKMLHTAAGKGMTSWFCCHRRELIKQSIKAFRLEGLRAGVVAAGFFKNERALTQIASIPTLAQRYLNLRAPNLMVWDEAHHIAAGSWSKIRKAYPKAFHIGLTATPQRLDGKGLREWFQELVMGPSVKWLIENNFLAPYRLYAPAGISTEGIGLSMGDFQRGQLEAAADKPKITGDAINHYQRLAAGKRAVVFCVSVKHSKDVVAQFNAAGIPAAHVDGETDVYERDEAIKKFERGEIRVLSNVELFGEGFDLPAIEVAILLRPTHSLGLYLQQCGRALRPCPGKLEAIILDHAGNCRRHGLPDDEREWSLDGAARKKNGGGHVSVSVRICPKCFAGQPSTLPSCKFCGHIFEIQSRRVEEVDGELVEIDPALLRREKAREQGQAQTIDDLARIGIARGYKKPWQWAAYVFKARQAKRLAGVQ